mgnify:CR=1 FL=1
MNYSRFLIMIFSLFVIVLPLRAQDNGKTILLKKILENITPVEGDRLVYINDLIYND